MMKDVLKLIIVDDHPIVIEGISSIFSKSDSINLIATFNNGATFIDYLDKNEVDVVLLDIFLPDTNGIDLCKIIKKKYPRLIVLGISSQSERSIVMQMIENGANGYLLKNASLKEFNDCIFRAYKGEIVYSDEVEKVITKFDTADFSSIPRLTKKEKEIVSWLTKGKSTQEIAEALFLSHFTVQTHRRNLLHKFESKNVAELINKVLKNGFL